MKKFIITLLLVFTAITTQAQEELTWHTDLNKAIDIANKEDKPLFLFFTGSDWCGWCIRLQKEVFKTPEFVKWAKEKVVLVELDYPRKSNQTDAVKTQNAQLQQFFKVQGYPTVWFAKATKANGKINFEQLGSTGYVAGGPSVWISGADKIIANYVATPKPVVVPKKSKSAKAKKK
jgi:thioredoxin-related protein